MSIASTLRARGVCQPLNSKVSSMPRTNLKDLRQRSPKNPAGPSRPTRPEIPVKPEATNQPLKPETLKVPDIKSPGYSEAAKALEQSAQWTAPPAGPAPDPETELTNHLTDGVSSNGNDENLQAGITGLNVDEPEGAVDALGADVSAPERAPDMDPGEFADFWGEIFGIAGGAGAAITGNPGWNYLAIQDAEREKWGNVAVRLHKLAGKHRRYLGWMLSPMNETAMTLLVLGRFVGTKVSITMQATAHFKRVGAPPASGQATEKAAGPQ